MRQIELLIVGDAGDGPVEEFVEITSLDEALDLFGGYFYERTAVTSGSTTFQLSQTPWGDEVVPLRADSDGVLVPQTLFEFTASGSVLSWSALGDWPPTGDPDLFTPTFSGEVVFRALAIPGHTSLLKGISAALTTGVRVHALRLGGVEANSGVSGGFYFTARYPGSRYNGTRVTVASGVVTIYPTAGNGRTRSYTPANDVALHDQIQRDLDRGYINVYFHGTRSRTSLTLPSGTYVLSGGTDGSMTADTLFDFVDQHDLEGVDVLCPVGLTTTQVSGSRVLDYLSEPFYPTLVVAQAPTSGAVLSGTINDRRNLCSVGFRAYYQRSTRFERLDDAAPMVAGIIASRQFYLTLAALPSSPVLPLYDQRALHAVTDQGHTLAYDSIGKGWCLYHAVTGDSRWAISTFRAFQEVVRTLYDHLEPLLGNTLLDLEGLKAQVGAGLAKITSGRILEWDLLRIVDTLYADVLFVPHGEVRGIEARIALGTPGDTTGQAL